MAAIEAKLDRLIELLDKRDSPSADMDLAEQIQRLREWLNRMDLAGSMLSERVRVLEKMPCCGHTKLVNEVTESLKALQKRVAENESLFTQVGQIQAQVNMAVARIQTLEEAQQPTRSMRGTCD